ncbi:WD40-repeat-containing domain protein [Schizothecium vesticola]|uniref:WD40-repeat-containing domain protein n=1 Tax=Schizothecium vesticola TaxID=314040 RepID=A0AA40EKK5_9PEZI|nr:WD40-repeat-containing domain protein [Schizothecium vesticola]
MKIKALSRSISAQQAPGADAQRAPRNLAPEIHPFERAREYQRALNAVKLERMFAKPFISQLGNGHVQGVYSMCKNPSSLSMMASGSGDGVVKVWSLTSREETWRTSAHNNIVKGLTFTNDNKLLSCGTDGIKLWDPFNSPSDSTPLASWQEGGPYTSLSFHRSGNSFAASSGAGCISVWDLEHSTAPQRIQWPNHTDTIADVCFNQVETSIVGSVATDRSVILFDLRTGMPVIKTVLKFAANRIAFNPMEAMNLAVASEDHNVYVFDARNFKKAQNIHKGHVAAVMDVEFSPTGEELVTGSYDRTVRIWRRDQGQSRDIYHTKRMQRVFRTCWTMDSKYLLSGSDDGNIRLWRANASERSAVKSTRQRQALEYNQALTERYSHLPEIKRIRRHRHVPKVVKKAGEIKRDELSAIKRREENERKHSAKQFEKRKGEREKAILALEQ